MNDLAKRFSQIGSTMLLCLAFVLVISLMASAGGVSSLQLVIGLAVLVVVLRLNFWRITRKFAEDSPTLPD